MKKMKLFQRVTALALALLLMGSAMLLSTGAASVSTAQMELRPNVTILVDGASRDFYNVQGQEVHPIFHNGTHYLPVRAIGELMGKNVNWDQSSLTVTLSGVRTTGTVRGTPDTAATVRSIVAEIRADFTIIVDGNRRVFYNEQGVVVHPVLYQGTTYLPVRAIGELMGKAVTWDQRNLVITLSASAGGSLVTDADTFNQGGAVTPSTPSTGGGTQTGTSYIGEERAKQIALNHAGLTAAQVTFVRSYLDWDDGRYRYDVEFYVVNGQTVKEYDYEIDAATGTIRDVDYDADYYSRPSTPSTGGGTQTGTSYIGEERAKSIALSSVGFTASQVTGMRCYLERDDGRWEYQVEFYKGTLEYDFEIDALTGAIRSRDVDSIYD